MLYTRSRIVNFRFSEEEFDLLKARCDEHGARSLSDYVRDVMLRTLKAGESPPTQMTGLARWNVG